VGLLAGGARSPANRWRAGSTDAESEHRLAVADADEAATIPVPQLMPARLRHAAGPRG
jgi:hypothetical protein